MTARRHLQWADDTARAALRLAAAGDPRDVVWQDFAACRETDPEIFFAEKGGAVAPAKTVCAGCCVRLQCLEYALENDERFGVFGGKSERERRRIKRDAA